MNKNKFYTKLSSGIFYFSILLFLIEFNFSDNPKGGWYQQFMPDIGGRQISDIFFLDSLTGWAVTPYIDLDDTAYVLKTNDGGNNWEIKYTRIGAVGFTKIFFLDSEVGFVCGANDAFGYKGLSKSTDGGINWIQLNVPDQFLQFNDMSVLSEDSIWLVSGSSTGGGVFLTTNGGQSWIRQFGGISNNPDKVYFFNANLGFISVNGVKLFRTSDGGNNWTEIQGDNGFTDLEFIDENTGWKANAETERIRKTTNGGVNWMSIWLPPHGSIIVDSRIKNLSVINNDTIWGDYPFAYYNSRLRGILYLTTNGGLTWGFQVPEDTIESNVPAYFHSQFLNKNTGWAYHLNHGVHTIAGGDTTILLNVKQLSNLIPEDFQLYQNYPNPFNPVTKIKFDILKAGKIRLSVYDVLGKEVATLVDEKLLPGSYEYNFDAGEFSSGVYFYSLIAEKFTITKKMLLTK